MVRYIFESVIRVLMMMACMFAGLSIARQVWWAVVVSLLAGAILLVLMEMIAARPRRREGCGKGNASIPDLDSLVGTIANLARMQDERTDALAARITAIEDGSYWGEQEHKRKQRFLNGLALVLHPDQAVQSPTKEAFARAFVEVWRDPPSNTLYYLPADDADLLAAWKGLCARAERWRTVPVDMRHEVCKSDGDT
jgi:hypothetical protein